MYMISNFSIFNIFLASKNQSNKYVTGVEDPVKLVERKHSFGKWFLKIILIIN